jgi:hypothetical protein
MPATTARIFLIIGFILFDAPYYAYFSLPPDECKKGNSGLAGPKNGTEEILRFYREFGILIYRSERWISEHTVYIREDQIRKRGTDYIHLI